MATDYKIKDIALSEWGLKEIALDANPAEIAHF